MIENFISIKTRDGLIDTFEVFSIEDLLLA